MGKKEQILDAAKEIFFKKSFYEATMEDIAEASGIKKSTIYYYYPSKVDLVFELIKESVEKILLSIENILREEKDPKEKVKKIVKFYMDIYEEGFKLFIIIQRLGYDFMQTEDEKEKVKEFFKELHKQKEKISKLFGDVMLSTGRKVSGEIFAGSLIGAIGKIIFERVSQNESMDKKKFLEIQEIFLAALN